MPLSAHSLRTAPHPVTADTVESKLYFELSQTHSGDDAVEHQRLIELEGPCITSFGTLAPTAVERDRVWHAIAGRATRRRGWLKLGRVDDGLRLKEVEKVLRKWVAEGRVDDAAVARWRDGARQRLKGTAEKNLPQDWKCKVRTRDADDHDTMLAKVRSECGERRSETAEPLEVKDHRPRASIVQRRLTTELAPELGIDSQEDIVRAWCESNLAEVSWHACIHRVSDGHDVWRDTAFIVYAQFAIEPELDDRGRPTGWWMFERAGTFPPLAPIIQVLWGKGPDGGAGTGALIGRWRTNLVELQNEGLKDAGFNRQYGIHAHRHGDSARWAPVRSTDAEGWSSMQALGEVPKVEPWLERWWDALTDEPAGQRVGRIAASIVEEWSEDETQRRACDARPSVRALCAHAQRWRSETEKWRETIKRTCDTWPSDPKAMAEVERLVEELEDHAMTLQAVATPEQRMSLEKAQNCGRAVKEANDAEVASRSALTVEETQAPAIKWWERHAGLQAVCVACSEGWEALQETSLRKCRIMREADVRKQSSSDTGRRLSPTHVRTLVENALSGRGTADHDIGAYLVVGHLGTRMGSVPGNDAMLEAVLGTSAKRADDRFQALREAGRRMMGLKASESKAFLREAARLAPTDAAQWVGADLGVAKHVSPLLWKAVQEPLRSFVVVAKRRVDKVVARAGPGEKDRAIATAFSPEELAVLASIAREPRALDTSANERTSAVLIAREVEQTVLEAKRRAEAQDRKLVDTLRDAESRVRGTRDPRKRSVLQTKLVKTLAKEQAHTVLSRVEWMRIACAGGAGAMEIGDGIRIEAEAASAHSFLSRLGSNSPAK